MPHVAPQPVENLKLDLNNYRTLPQKTEADALHALISMNPGRFWGLADSLLKDGYLGTENIIVLKGGTGGAELIVKEGNRRIGALKLILGKIPKVGVVIPSEVQKKITGLSPVWIKQNSSVPCHTYDPVEAAAVARLVELAHGLGEAAARLHWEALARARHRRDLAGGSEPALDLLEKYLKVGKNLTVLDRERWGGDYPVTVLEEAMQKIAPRYKLGSAREVEAQYPTNTAMHNVLDEVIHDIGSAKLETRELRDAVNDFGARYGIPPLLAPPAPGGGSGPAGGGSGGSVKPKSSGRRKPIALSVNDPRAVKRTLKKFPPRGSGAGRGKIAALWEEAQKLNLSTHPHAFCFVLRSLFELSAKAYCDDHSIPTTDSSGKNDKKLAALLDEIVKHLTKNGMDAAMVKKLHGPKSDLSDSKTGFLSVTSLNQLVHNRTFITNESHIAGVFHNVFPLLEEMNG